MKPSQSNAGAEIGKILERFRLSQGWKAEEDEDHDLRLTTFLEILGAARIPVNLYDRLYRRVSVTRARKKANGESVSYYIAPEEMVAEYFTLQNELKKDRDEQRAPKCANEKYHVGDGAQVLSDLFNSGRDELAPCPTCRTDEYSNWRKNQIALYGEIPIKTFLPQIEMKPMAGIFTAKPEEILPRKEADDLAEQHNIIICQITDDDATQKMEMVIFDEGANVFKHKNRNDKLYSAKDLRKRIERYSEILEGK